MQRCAVRRCPKLGLGGEEEVCSEGGVDEEVDRGVEGDERVREVLHAQEPLRPDGQFGAVLPTDAKDMR